MIRKLFPILFIVIYTFSVLVGSTIGRVQAWTAERPPTSKHHSWPHAVRIGEWHRRPARQVWQTKILEDGSSLVSPFVRATPPHFATGLHHFSVDFRAGHSVQVFSSRAPPTTIS